jgi:hypothetical protein
VDLLIDRASVIDPNKPVVGSVRLDTLSSVGALLHAVDAFCREGLFGE